VSRDNLEVGRATVKVSVVVATLVTLTIGSMALGAQSNQFMDELLSQEEARYGDVAYVTLAAAGVLAPDASTDATLQALADRAWAIPGREASDPVSMGEYAYLLMRAFGLKGGIMYSIVPGPRYATRELAYLGVIDPEAEPGMTVSGERVLRVLGRMLEMREAQS
jgi:hypothetical protein